MTNNSSNVSVLRPEKVSLDEENTIYCCVKDFMYKTENLCCVNATFCEITTENYFVVSLAETFFFFSAQTSGAGSFHLSILFSKMKVGLFFSSM